MTDDDKDDDVGPTILLPEQVRPNKVTTFSESTVARDGSSSRKMPRQRPSARLSRASNAGLSTTGLPEYGGGGSSSQRNVDSSGGRPSRMISDIPPSQRRISTRDLNFGIPSHMAAEEHVEEVNGINSMKAAALRFLHQKWVQMILLALLLMDILIMFAELLLLSAFPACSVIVRDCIACCSESHTEQDEGGIGRWLAEGGEHEEICEVGYENIGQPSCDEHKWHVVHTTEEVLFWITITILTVFMVEILVEIWALSPCVFFRQCFFTMDFIVISFSLVLEVLFHYISKVWAQELVGFVVFFRMWRFVRIGHGIVEVTSELTHEMYDELLEYAAQCEDIIEENGLKLPTTTQRVHKMVEDAEEDHHL